ncbi:hypothetical protein P3X46_024013 [Hevea brasiliensis]|uniref:Post-GPI attachment to proteins factor 3 n=1 Tax=Hevea brasiliensis TaxID=3981 RepID=A0ABQ9LDW9_HEVBR|nr:hypothetical protein P3X46_024013 [Hevea brasiliensis]
MVDRYWIGFFLVISLLKDCVGQCEQTGCVGQRCFSRCKFSSDGDSIDGPWYMQEPLYLRWKQWDCQSDCRYHCMLDREKERDVFSHGPVKYHGKWPFTRLYGIQEPASVAFSALNLAIHFHGWHTMNIDVDLTEKMDYSSAVALVGYSLILLRSFNVKDEAARVMVAAPLLAFVTTHILFFNFYKLDYGWNMKICVIMAVAQLLIWASWAGISRHPSRQIYDFPPYKGFVDAHALWHASTIPLTYIWWSFIRDEAEFRTSNLLKKAK